VTLSDWDSGHVRRRFFASAAITLLLFVAEPIGALALAGDDPGVATWKVISEDAGAACRRDSAVTEPLQSDR
jgi:hypothetical protein